MSRWVPSRPEYYVQTGGMHENPFGVPHEEIARMVIDMTPEVAAQVVFGKYVESSGLVFTSDLIQGMIDRRLGKVPGQYYVNEKVRDSLPVVRMRERNDWDERFHGGLDFARKTDYTVITVLDTLTTPATLVYYRRLNRVPWETIYEEIGRVRHLFGPNLLGDSTGPGGDAVFDALDSRAYCPLHHRTPQFGYRCSENGQQLEGCSPDEYLPLSCVDSYDFNGRHKADLIEHLRNVLAVGYNAKNPVRGTYGWIRTPIIPQLTEELTLYSWDDKKLMTDCVFSLALACRSAWEDLVDNRTPEYGSVYGD